MVNKKIALLVPCLGGGGAERMMANLTKGLADREFDIDLVLFRKEGIHLNIIPPSVNIIDLKIDRALFSFWKISRYLKKNKPDAMISTLSRVNIAAVIAKKITGVRTRIILREANTFSIYTKISSGLADKLIYYSARIFYRWADKIVAVSGGVADDLLAELKLEESKVRVIYNPVVDEDLFNKAAEKPELEYFVNKTCPVIMAAGRIAPQKDFPTLIKAFNEVLKEKKCNLVIFGSANVEEGGSPKEFETVESLINEFGIKDKVFFPGYEKNIFRYFKNADLFVLSSQAEGLPGVLIQAIACGCPVVSTDCPSGPSEVLDNGKYGSLVKVGDYKSLANEMLKTLENPLKPEVLIERSKDFSTDKSVNQYLEEAIK